ncbi:hypothetical protein NEUTE1DRAFT_38528, partial [Neurospora tetrasperma FGSC 2508]
YCIYFNLFITYIYIRIKEGDEWKIVFYIFYKYYKYFVIPFGLINIPTIF